MQRQCSMIPKVTRMTEIHPMPYIDRIDDVFVVMRSQVLTIKIVQSIMNSTQVQLIGLDTATLTPYCNVTDTRRAIRQVTPWRGRLSGRLRSRDALRRIASP